MDDPYDFGRIAATNALSDVYAMGGTPIMALALLGMPLGKLSVRRCAASWRAARRSAPRPASRWPAGTRSTARSRSTAWWRWAWCIPDRVLRNSGAQPGDVLILTKGLGVGIFSAALKRGELAADGYATMLASTTQLNTWARAGRRWPGCTR